MAKYNWPHQEAKRLTGRLKEQQRPAVFETGYGPSGLPHIGTFAEVARTSYIMDAYKHANPDKPVQLIVFSDDMDGLRSLPDNVPNHDLLRPHLGAPLTRIPDPFGKEKSYADYMNSRLRHFLDFYGFDYEFRSSTACYQAGLFNSGLQSVMDNYQQVRELFIQTIAKDKREAWSPFFPICEACGKIYTTRVTDIHPDSYQLSYHCDLDGKTYRACHHQGRVSVLDGHVKVGWKIDWAMRWFVFGIDYEMHGKDLMDSAALSSKICRVLGGKPPLTYKYELFLDEKGAKISKTIGNGVSMEQWQAYSPVGALLLFLLENPNKARKMGLPILPRLIDNYLTSLRKEDRSEPTSALWFVDQLQHHHDAAGLDQSDLTYALLVNVAESLGDGGAELLYDYARRYDSAVAENAEFFHALCRHVVAYVSEYAKAQPGSEVIVTDSSLSPLLVQLYERIKQLNSEQNFTAERLQNCVFAVAREHELEQKSWFLFLYQSLLHKDQGPRLGSFFAMLGFERVERLFQQAIGAVEQGGSL